MTTTQRAIRRVLRNHDIRLVLIEGEKVVAIRKGFSGQEISEHSSVFGAGCHFAPIVRDEELTELVGGF